MLKIIDKICPKSKTGRITASLTAVAAVGIIGYVVHQKIKQRRRQAKAKRYEDEVVIKKADVAIYEEYKRHDSCVRTHREAMENEQFEIDYLKGQIDQLHKEMANKQVATDDYKNQLERLQNEGKERDDRVRCLREDQQAFVEQLKENASKIAKVKLDAAIDSLKKMEEYRLQSELRAIETANQRV